MNLDATPARKPSALPCKTCGAAAEVSNYGTAKCSGKCHEATPFRWTGVEAWNRRAMPDAVRELLDALRENDPARVGKAIAGVWIYFTPPARKEGTP